MSIKAMMSTLTISAFVSLGAAGAAGALAAHSAVVHTDARGVTAGVVLPNDGGAGNG